MKKLLFFLSFLFLTSAFADSARVISLSPDLTEILFDLGITQEIIATVDHSDFPEGANNIMRVGSFVSPNIEKILSLNPTLVLCRHGATPQKTLSILKDNKIPFQCFSCNTLKDIFHSIYRLGELLHKEEKAHLLIKEMKHSLKESQKKISSSLKPRVLIQLEETPLMVAGKETLLDEALRLSGGINAASQFKGYPKVQREMVLKLNPEIILIPITKGEEEKFKRMANVWQGQKRVYLINGDLISRGTPRFIQGIRELSLLLHREKDVSF